MGTSTTKSGVSPAEAVLLGALAPGVNAPTWNTLKSAFLLLAASLAVMLGLAFASSDSWLVVHVGFLVLITAALFCLLSCLGFPTLGHRFLSQTGLVSIEHQMQDLNLAPKDRNE